MVQSEEGTQRRLQGILYRFDCPSPLSIGEYVMDLLDAQSRLELAGHALECGPCQAELHTARAFLDTSEQIDFG